MDYQRSSITAPLNNWFFNVRETVRHFAPNNGDGIYVVKVIVLKGVTQGSRSSAVSLEVRDFIHTVSKQKY